MKDSITFSQKPISINKDGVLLKLSDIDTNVYIKHVDESFKDSVKTLRIYLHRETSVKISKPYENPWEPKAEYNPSHKRWIAPSNSAIIAPSKLTTDDNSIT